MIHYLYLLTNTDLNKSYVGVTSDLKARLANHMKHKTNSQIMLDREIYNFEMEVLCEGSKEFIYDLEEDMIQHLKTRIPNGYNVAYGGVGGNTGNSPLGEKNSQAKLTEEKVLEIRQLIATTGISHEKLGLTYGVSRATIGDICNGKSWSHVGGPITSRKTRPKDVSFELRQQIRNLYLSGITIIKISETLNVPYHTAFKYSKKEL